MHPIATGWLDFETAGISINDHAWKETCMTPKVLYTATMPRISGRYTHLLAWNPRQDSMKMSVPYRKLYCGFMKGRVMVSLTRLGQEYSGIFGKCRALIQKAPLPPCGCE